MKFRGGGDPVLYLSNPAGLRPTPARRDARRPGEAQRDASRASIGDPEIDTRIAQYEMAFRMQTSRAGADRPLEGAGSHLRPVRRRTSRKPGTFAANCLLARRLAERGVRFIQLYHRGWDQHGNLPRQITDQCRDDRPARPRRLIQDLKQRGLLDDTLVIWGGEFGRTVYCQGKLTARQLRPRPPPALLHHLDGRRRHQAGHHHRRDRRLLLQRRRRTRSTSTT